MTHFNSLRSRLVIGLFLAFGFLSCHAIAQDIPTGPQDTSLPIEITAKSLEVLQDQQMATFKGNVRAVQGEMVFLADQVQVAYRRDENGTVDGKRTISRIDAKGQVKVSMKDLTASGAWGIYDVDRELMTLGGKVSLQQGENQLESDRLEIDLKNGTSRLISDSKTGEGERVRGVFTPPQRDEKSDEKKDEKTASPKEAETPPPPQN